MSWKHAFSRFFDASPDRLHFAAHSQHPWPDVSYDAHKRYWEDSVRLADDKWGEIFGALMPQTRKQIADILSLSDPDTLTFAPNTHDFLVRIFSCLEPPVRILSTDSEFHSFTRQSHRWEEEGLAIVDRVPAEPFETFAERFTLEARAGVHDLIYLSQVFFDSGFVVPDIDRIVSSVPENRTFIVIDGYHGFMARPTSLESIQDRVFFLAGGYKYAMSGEGVCFLHSPPGYGPRPVDTGWYAGFGELEPGVSTTVPYAEDGSRFAPATYDPSGIYRMNSVLGWLAEDGTTVADIRQHVVGLQDHFLQSVDAPGVLIPGKDSERGNFITYRNDGAEHLYTALHERGVITDYRRDRLRFGFGIYQDLDDIDRLAQVLTTL